MGVEKERYDALAAMFDGEAAPQARFGPLPPNGSANQKALGIACWYLRDPDKRFGNGAQETTVRKWALNFFASQLAHGMWQHEPNSNTYHHLYAAAGWSIYNSALQRGDGEVATTLLVWLRNDLAAAALFATRDNNTFRVVAPGARGARIQSLSRDIALQQQLSVTLERHPGHNWWNYRRNRESLGAAIHATCLSVLTPEEKEGAREWITQRTLSPAFVRLIAPLRYSSPVEIVDTDHGWHAFFPRLDDCWDNAQPAVAVDDRGIRRLRARDDDTGAEFWHQSRPITCKVEGGQLVASGDGQRGAVNVPLSTWQGAIQAARGTPRRRIEIGTDSIRIDGQALETSPIPTPPDCSHPETTPPPPPLMGPHIQDLYEDLGRQIVQRRVMEERENWNNVRRIIDRQRRILEDLKDELRL